MGWQVDYTGNINTAGTDADATARISYTYDLWGRTLTYTNDLGDVTTTTWGSDGNIASIADAKGTTSYSYTSADANGGYEHRGMPTRLTVTRAGSGGNLVFTGAYDARNVLIRQNLPGQIIARTTLDEAGQPIGLSYSGQVTPVTETTDPDTGATTYTPGTPQADQPWLAWTQTNDVVGRVRAETTGPGAAFDGTPGVTNIADVNAPTIGHATSYGRTYTYDPAGRLTTIADNTSTGYGTPTTVCTVRSYTFNTNGNRTNLNSATHPDGDCSSTTGTTTTNTTYAYDTADRPTTGANGTGSYTYDLFGRQTTLPAADAPTPPAGNITLGYYDDDLPRSITQNGTNTTLTLDSAGRRLAATTTGGTTQTLIRHYGNTTDNPTWADTTIGGTTTTTRYITTLDGLGATITGDGTTTLPLTNLHGDAVTTTTTAPSTAGTTPATTIDGWTDYTEYGTPRTSPTETRTITGTIGYGWLATHQRSNTPETAGLTLMGVRLYNPTRALFTSKDPIPGGNSTAYSYPQDPSNFNDTSGEAMGSNQRRWCRRSTVTAAYCATYAYSDTVVAKDYAAYVRSLGYSENIANAFQHFVWMVQVSFRVGAYWARELGKAHEADGGDGPLDTKRDLANNEYGISAGQRARSDRIRSWRMRAWAKEKSWDYYFSGALKCITKTSVVSCNRTTPNGPR